MLTAKKFKKFKISGKFMATIDQFKMSKKEKLNRRFSEDFKVKKVREIEKGTSTPTQVSKSYDVSLTSVYKWIDKYGTSKENTERLIIESKSDTVLIANYQRKIAELERLIGQKQVMIDFQSKIIELAEQEYRIDIKKKYSDKP